MRLTGRQIPGPSLTFGPTNSLKSAGEDFTMNTCCNVYEPVRMSLQ